MLLLEFSKPALLFRRELSTLPAHREQTDKLFDLLLVEWHLRYVEPGVRGTEVVGCLAGTLRFRLGLQIRLR